MNDEVTGKARGGKARAEKLSAEARKEIASKAARERWNKPNEKLALATHIGVIKVLGSQIPCAVLENGQRVLTQEGFLDAIGRAKKAKAGQGATVDNTPAFLAANNLKPFISEELMESTTPIVFKGVTGVRGFGYKAELLPKVCRVYLDARDAKALSPKQEHIAKHCEMLVRALAETAIVALVDEATGYQEVRPKDALQAYMEMLVRKELAAWTKTFPDEFYENIYKLKNWPWQGMSKNRYSVVAQYTIDLVYERLAPGLVDELKRKSPVDEKGRRKNKLFQWLTDDIGHPLLAQHIYSLMMFQKLAIANGFGWNRFVKMVDQVLPKRGTNFEFEFMHESFPTLTEPPS